MPAIDRPTAIGLLTEARVARLATVTAEAKPHVVPCCFAVVGETIVSVVDGKPKSTGQLRRLDNIRAHPAASILVDRYDDDWTNLWWVRVDGQARVVLADGDNAASHAQAIDVLAAKYHQYIEDRPIGALVVVEIDRVTGWSFSEIDSD